MSKLRSWFCDSSSEEESESSEEEENINDETWEKVKRTKQNKEKRQRQRKNKKEKQAETALKASFMIGIGPVTKESIGYFESLNKDTEEAKKEAVEEYLRFYLRYNTEEIEQLEIAATQIAPKDDVIYIAFNNSRDVHNIYQRAAQCKHPEVTTQNYIPPQFFDRYIYLSKRCQELRQKEKGHENTDEVWQTRY